MNSCTMVWCLHICFLLAGTVNPLWGEKNITKVQVSKRLMGTEVRILVDAPSSSELNHSISAAFREGERLNMILSDWEGESELSQLSRSSEFGKPFTLSQELWEVLLYSQTLAHQSRGAFDVTVGSLSRLWRIARHQKRLPEPQKLHQTIQRTGYEKLLVNESNPTATLTTQGMVLDLGGIAKGYIADQMLALLKKSGFPRCLIDAGGDLTIGDPPLSARGWRVEVGGISGSEIPPLALSNCAVATSGDLEQFLELEGKRYSHLINPKSGLGLKGGAQVTIIAKNGMTADALASTCLVLGLKEAKSFLAKSDYNSMYYLELHKSSKDMQVYELHKSDTE